MQKIFVGIDIAKHHHQATMIDESGKILGSSFRFSNTTSGGKNFLSRLMAVNPVNLPVQIGLEATGHYWLPLYSFLTEKGFAVVVINPYQSDAWRKIYLSSVKTDKEDAFLIADILRFGSFQESHVPDESLVALRNLTRFRVAVNLQMTDTKRRILTVLDQVFPEFQTLFSDVFGKTAKGILETYATPDALESLSVRKLTNLLAKFSKGRFGKEKATEIKDTAKDSFGITYALDSFTLQLRLLLKQLELLDEQLEQLDQEIASLMNPTVLTSLPGVGPTIAAAITAEVGDFKRFRTASQLIAYAGINPTVKQSGNFLGNKNRMSKKGSPYLRLALWQAAVTSSRFNPILKAFYQKKIKEGKHPMTATGAVARKLAGIMFSMLKNNQQYIGSV